MRKILFRGKRLDNDEWVEGYLEYFYSKDGTRKLHCYISIWGEIMHKVDPDTVGQFTGMMANGKRIFEGDIVKLQYDTVFEMTGQVVFEDATFQLVDPDGTHECLWYEPHEMEVIGNIHDNPELLEVTQDE